MVLKTISLTILRPLAQDLEVITEDVPMLIEVDISRKEQVLPMVPAGKSNHEMLGVKFHA